MVERLSQSPQQACEDSFASGAERLDEFGQRGSHIELLPLPVWWLHRSCLLVDPALRFSSNWQLAIGNLTNLPACRKSKIVNSKAASVPLLYCMGYCSFGKAARCKVIALGLESAAAQTKIARAQHFLCDQDLSLVVQQAHASIPSPMA